MNNLALSEKHNSIQKSIISALLAGQTKMGYILFFDGAHQNFFRLGSRQAKFRWLNPHGQIPGSNLDVPRTLRPSSGARAGLSTSANPQVPPYGNESVSWWMLIPVI